MLDMIAVHLSGVFLGMSRGSVSRGRGGVSRYQPRPDTDLRYHHVPPHRPLTPHRGPDDPSGSADVSATSAGETEERSDEVEGQTESDVSGRQAKPSYAGRRKAGSARLAFQYPDVFGRRRTRGGSTAAAGRRRTITSGRINFRHRTAQTRRYDVTSGDAATQPEANLNTVDTVLACLFIYLCHRFEMYILEYQFVMNNCVYCVSM